MNDAVASASTQKIKKGRTGRVAQAFEWQPIRSEAAQVRGLRRNGLGQETHAITQRMYWQRQCVVRFVSLLLVDTELNLPQRAASAVLCSVVKSLRPHPFTSVQGIKGSSPFLVGMRVPHVKLNFAVSKHDSTLVETANTANMRS